MTVCCIQSVWVYLCVFVCVSLCVPTMSVLPPLPVHPFLPFSLSYQLLPLSLQELSECSTYVAEYTYMYLCMHIRTYIRTYVPTHANRHTHACASGLFDIPPSLRTFVHLFFPPSPSSFPPSFYFPLFSLSLSLPRKKVPLSETD